MSTGSLRRYSILTYRHNFFCFSEKYFHFLWAAQTLSSRRQASAGFLLPGIKQQSIFTQPTILRYQRKNLPLQQTDISV